jgi:hypothetical protein
VLAAATLVVFVNLFFFFPRVSVWRAMNWGIAEVNNLPELHRAAALWKQVQDPTLPINDLSNRPLQ